MRIAVVGAGALGCTFSALLDRAGHEVTLVARGAQLDAIRRDGLRLGGGFGEWTTTRLVAVPELSEQPELALLCVKAQDAREALEQHGRFIDGIPVLVVQNGLSGIATASELLPHSRCFGALSIIAASYLEPGSVTVTTPATTYIGRGDGVEDAEALRWQKLVGTELRLQTIPNFVGAQWTKLIVNQINALPAITGLSAQEVIGIRPLRRLMTASMREAVRTGIASGIRFGALQGLGDRRLRFFSRLPLTLGQALPLLFKLRMGAVPNPGSTLQSIKRGARTEVDFLNGAVVTEAEKTGRTAPLNSLLTALVHEVEESGRFLTPSEVAERWAALAR